MVLWTKVVTLAAIVIVAILSLSYDHAYGALSPAFNLHYQKMSDSKGEISFRGDIQTHDGRQTVREDGLIIDARVDTGEDVPEAVPEPATLLLFGFGLIAAARFIRH